MFFFFFFIHDHLWIFLNFDLCRYKITGQLTKESDVYSFEIVLLELISGQPAIMEDGSDILNWFLPIFERAKIEDILDPKLQGIFKTHSALRAVETTMSCIPSSPIERKTMSYVVSELKECLKLQVEMTDEYYRNNHYSTYWKCNRSLSKVEISAS